MSSISLLSDIKADISLTLFFKNTSGPSLAKANDEKRIKIVIMYGELSVQISILKMIMLNAYKLASNQVF